jgi:zinc protease
VTPKAALVAAFLFGFAAAPAAAQIPPGPTLQTASNGMQYHVAADPAQPSAAISLWYRAPGAGFETPALPGLSRVAALTVAASTPITGTSLTRLVQSVGGRIDVSAYADSVAVTIVVAPEHVDRVVRALTADYFAPVVDAAGFALARRDVAEDTVYRSYDAPDALEHALEGALFSSGPFHDGTLPDAKTMAALDVTRVQAYADRAFRPSNAVLILTGNVSPSVIEDAASRDGADPAPERPAQQVAVTPGSVIQHTANVEGTGLGWVGPSIQNEAETGALDFLSDALFAPKVGSVQRALGSLDVEVTGKFITYFDPGLFLVTISGKDAQAALPIVRRAIAQVATPMSPQVFASARIAFQYRVASDLQTPGELADTLGWYAVEGNFGSSPASTRYLQIESTLTPRFVASMGARYLTAAPAIVTLARARPQATGTP